MKQQHRAALTSTKHQPTTRAGRAAERRRNYDRRRKRAYRQRRQQEAEQRRPKGAPRWRHPPQPPEEPYVPMQKEPGEILTNYTKPRRLTAKRRQRQMVMQIKSALERDRQW